MALFLNESLTEFDIEVISIEEAYDGLLEASMDMHELTESLLHADFIIHEECKVLTETQQEDKQVNFLVKAVQAIKAFLIKITEKIKTFLTSLVNRVKMFWTKFTAKLGINSDILVPNGMDALVEILTSELTYAQKLSTMKNIGKVKLETSANKIKALMIKFTDKVKTNKGDTKKVKLAKFAGVFTFLSGLVVTAGFVSGMQANTKEVIHQEEIIKIISDKRAKGYATNSGQQQVWKAEFNEAKKALAELQANGKYGLQITNSLGTFAGTIMVGLMRLVVSKDSFENTAKAVQAQKISKINAPLSSY